MGATTVVRSAIVVAALVCALTVALARCPRPMPVEGFFSKKYWKKIKKKFKKKNEVKNVDIPFLKRLAGPGSGNIAAAAAAAVKTVLDAHANPRDPTEEERQAFRAYALVYGAAPNSIALRHYATAKCKSFDDLVELVRRDAGQGKDDDSDDDDDDGDDGNAAQPA